jgi:hypothetical protein
MLFTQVFLPGIKTPCFKGVLIKNLMVIFVLVIFKLIKMKKILLSVLCILVVCLVNAQSQFGIINYTLPGGWYARQLGNDIELVKKEAENSNCKITLFQQVNRAVNSEIKYAELWALKTKSGNAKIPNTIPPVKTEEDGWISFSGFKVIGKSTPPYSEGFYTLSDGSKTAIILAEAQGSSCINEINSILASINIPEKETNTKTKAKSKKVRVLPLKSLKALVN